MNFEEIGEYAICIIGFGGMDTPGVGDYGDYG